MKIIRKPDRIILIKKELDNVDHWTELFDSLTFAEGIAMSQAMEKFSKKFFLMDGRESK